MSVTYRLQALSTEVDSLEASIAKILLTLDFWSDIQATVVVNDTAADKTLPNVTVAELPSTATIVRAIMMFKYNKRVDSSAAPNATVSAQVISIDAAAGRDSPECVGVVESRRSVSQSA